MSTIATMSKNIVSALPSSSLSSIDLCSRCGTMDFLEIFSRRIEQSIGEFVLDLGSTVEELKASECPLCRLFGAVTFDGTLEDIKPTTRCHVRAFSSIQRFASMDSHATSEVNSTLLGVLRIERNEVDAAGDVVVERIDDSLRKSGMLGRAEDPRTSSNFGVRALSSESFDVSFAINCIKYCQLNHQGTCKPQVVATISYLKFIDCRSQTIVSAPESCQYVALSYVWGTPTPAARLETADAGLHDRNGLLLHNVPKVISDSIEVTLKLGFQYLWIDQYCIDQTNPDDKASQIGQMDLIYMNAQITIIAAAGEDSSFGLPGVHGTLRRPQPQLRVRDHILASSLRVPREVVEASKWSTRGWTYQEGLLSPRRLIFTTDQVLWECNSMHCAEAQLLVLDLMHVKDKSQFGTQIPFGAFRDKSPGSNPWEVMTYIHDFSQRQLSYAGDTINALRGVLNTFSRGTPPVYHFLGVPILPDCRRTYAEGPWLSNNTPEERFILGLTWYHLTPGKRMDDFPSWSWAGWNGVVSSTLSPYIRSSVRKFSDTKVWIESKGQPLRRFPTEDDLQLFLTQHIDPRPFLHIETKAFVCRIVSNQSQIRDADVWHPTYQLEADFPDTTTIYIEIYVSSTTVEHDVLQEVKVTAKKEYLGAILGDSSVTGREKSGIIVENMGDHAIRIASFSFKGAKYRSQDTVRYVGDRALGKWIDTLHTKRIRIS